MDGIWVGLVKLLKKVKDGEIIVFLVDLFVELVFCVDG